MQQIGPVLADPLLQIGDAAGQLSPLVLQSGNDMRLGHNPYPLEKMGLCSSGQRYLASRSWWRLIHKTGFMSSPGTRAIRPPSPKKPVWTAPSPERRARSGHAGEGEATDPRSDPARR